jgi:hypothetical protein
LNPGTQVIGNVSKLAVEADMNGHWWLQRG